ncbi:MAG: hypothetical protein ACE144_12905 [Thermodesulfobacteriota bacterium]
MKELSPLESLSFFEQNLPEFLVADPKIKTQITNLRRILADEKSPGFHAELLENGKNIIKHIISKSIEFLSDESNSPKNRSIETVAEYIDTFTVFEEMLFGLDENYRDHTIHSLWVYLFGHEFINCIGGYNAIKIAGQTSIGYSKPNKTGFTLFTDLQKGEKAHMEAMWGMISILHDLGYPIQDIIKTPHDVFRKILDPFAIDLNSIFQVDIGSRITLLHQSVCDLVSTTYRPEPITHDEEVKFFMNAEERGKRDVYRQPTLSKDEGVEMEFRIASVDKIHSAWSSILAFKNIAYLHESDYHGGGSRNYLKLLTRRDILYSILHHTCEEPNDIAVNRFQFILLLMDDVEETIRYSRGGKLRGLRSKNCKVEWEVDKDKTIIKLDYTEYGKDDAQSKYEEMEKKYKAQESRNSNDPRYGYVIEIRFIDEKNKFQEDLKLLLSKEKEGMENSEAIPSPAIPETDR